MIDRTDHTFDALSPRDRTGTTSDSDYAVRQGSLATFTLLLPSQRLDIRLVKQPYSPVLRQVLERKGYARLVRNKLTDHEVLLSIEGAQLSLHALQWAINEDGHQRHMRWNLAGSSKSIREVSISRSYIPEGELRQDGSQKYLWKKWIVPCNTENEAGRFVKVWHRRDIAPLLGGGSRTEKIIVNAELAI